MTRLKLTTAWQRADRWTARERCFIELCKKHSERHGNRFDYTLLDAWDVP